MPPPADAPNPAFADPAVETPQVEAPNPAFAPQPEAEIAAQQPAPTPQPAPTEKKRKRKIDLKSRLSSVRATGSMAAINPSLGDRKSDPLSFPPPPSAGSVPAPKLPGGLLPSVSSPFAPPEPKEKPTAQAQTIKVEVGEEIVEQRKKAKKSTFLVAALVLVVGGALGFVLGSAYKAGEAGRAAAKNAQGLMEDVVAAQTQAGDMSDTIRKAEEMLTTDEYPKDLAKYLRDTSVEFGPEKYGERKPGGLPRDVLGSMIRYANDVDKFQKQKRKVATLLDRSAETVTEFFESKKTKKAGYAITVTKVKSEEKDSKDFWFVGNLGSIDEPFAWDKKDKWPGEKFKIKVGRDGAEVIMANQNIKDFGAAMEKKAAIVLDPETTAQLSRGGQVWLILRTQVHELYELIEGKESNDPNQQMNGIIKDGKVLVTGLKKVVEAGQR